MTRVRATLAGLAIVALAPAAQAGTITLDSITTPLAYNAQVTAAPDAIASGIGQTVSTGLNWSGGASMGAGIADTFLAWCFDLIHPVGLNGTYDYEVTTTPYSGSYLLGGADTRVSNLINANYASLDPADAVQSAAFQLAVWEVANDNDFDLLGGVFQAMGVGTDAAAITGRAQDYLAAAQGYSGVISWRATFLETREATASQNLVTAVRVASDTAPVPLPASALLLMGGLGMLAGMRSRRAAA